MGENDNVIAIKIFFSESAPLFCKLVLQKVATVNYNNGWVQALFFACAGS